MVSSVADAAIRNDWYGIVIDSVTIFVDELGTAINKAITKDTTQDDTDVASVPKSSRKDPVHHIVAQRDPRAEESRKILLGCWNKSNY